MSRAGTSSILYCIAVPFFGGFLGALGVAVAEYVLSIFGIVSQFNVSFQWIQDFSWGGAMWGFIPALFLLARKGNAYLTSLFTMIIAVSYGLFVLQKIPPSISFDIIVVYAVNLVYVGILGFVITHSYVLMEYKFVFQNLLPKPVTVTKLPKRFFHCPHCNAQFEHFTEFSNHYHTHNENKNT
jgi:hypothetical protein